MRSTLIKFKYDLIFSLYIGEEMPFCDVKLTTLKEAIRCRRNINNKHYVFSYFVTKRLVNGYCNVIVKRTK